MPATSGATRRLQRSSSIAAVTLVVLTLLLPLSGCSAVGAQLRAFPGPAQQVTPSVAATAGPSVHEIAQTTMLTRATIITASATCPQGEFALGGGWDVPTQARVFAAQLNRNTWTVSVAGYKGPITVTASVECLRGVGRATVTQRAFPVPADPDELTDVLSTCNYGETLVGGGLKLGTTGMSRENRLVLFLAHRSPWLLTPLVSATARSFRDEEHARTAVTKAMKRMLKSDREALLAHGAGEQLARIIHEGRE